MAKVILISQFPLPYSKIGSWTTLYGNYLTSEHQIDIIICPKPDDYFPNIQYGIVKKTLMTRIKRKIFGKSYEEYLLPLKRILNRNESYIIQIVDNHGLVPAVGQFLKKKKMWQNCCLQFFFHGFSPLYNNYYGGKFLSHVHELVLLTKLSYKNFVDYYNVLPCKISILPNGIDTRKFSPLDQVQQQDRKAELGLAGKTIFIWCSQDRRKKGLDLILEAWKNVYPQFNDAALLVVGSKRNINIEGVTFIGPVPNNKLPYYFQVSDVYLFPTLCHEGFGMSLIEAMHCGCFAIASALGGVPEVLQFGRFGTLIENPHFVSEWVDAMTGYLKNPSKTVALPADLYTTESWNKGMNEIITSAKIGLSR